MSRAKIIIRMCAVYWHARDLSTKFLAAFGTGGSDLQSGATACGQMPECAARLIHLSEGGLDRCDLFKK
jgi:hypothetical protein